MIFGESSANQLIIVVNDRFLPSNNSRPHPYGVTGFANSLLEELTKRECQCGLILYKRREGLEVPYLEAMHWRGLRAIRIHFDFTNRTSELKALFERCIRSFAGGRIEPAKVIVYHQTPTLVFLTPPDIPFVVTHHGPFATEIIRLFGETFAREAFDGGQQKLRHLIERQTEGLHFLLDRDNGAALEMSQVQQEALLRFGVPDNRVRVCPPIIRVPLPSKRSRISKSEKTLTVFAAAARLDRFKQFPTLIDAANKLYETGIDLQLVVYAGNSSHSINRAELLNRVVSGLKNNCHFHNSLPHEQLIELFKEAHNRNIFVSTSVYETFGITPLESALSGVPTVVPNLPFQVGISSLFPSSSKFNEDDNGLFIKLQEMIAHRDLSSFGYDQMVQVREKLSRSNFVDTLFEIISSREQVQPI